MAPQPAVLSPQDKLQAIEKLKRRVADLEAFQPGNLTNRADPKIEALGQSIRRTLEQIYGSESTDFIRLESTSYLDTASLNYMHPTPLYEVVEGLKLVKERAIELLNGEIRALVEEDRAAGTRPRITPTSTIWAPITPM